MPNIVQRNYERRVRIRRPRNRSEAGQYMLQLLDDLKMYGVFAILLVPSACLAARIFLATEAAIAIFASSIIIPLVLIVHATYMCSYHMTVRECLERVWRTIRSW